VPQRDERGDGQEPLHAGRPIPHDLSGLEPEDPDRELDADPDHQQHAHHLHGQAQILDPPFSRAVAHPGQLLEAGGDPVHACSRIGHGKK